MNLPSLSRRRILIVEDNGMVRETIVLMLEDDYDVEAAGSVAAALDLLRRPGAAIDVMLLDCLLPDGDPTELLAAADGGGIPVVLTSGDPRQADLAGTGRWFLSKPFTQVRLLAILDSARR